jgi:hypothetical protein
MSKTFTNAPRVTTLATADILAGDIGGASSGITAGNFRKALFAFAAADPLNIGALTAVGNSTITGTLSGITTLTATSLVLAGTITGVSTLTTGGAVTVNAGGIQVTGTSTIAGITHVSGGAAGAVSQDWTDATNYTVALGYASVPHFWATTGSNVLVLGAGGLELLRLDNTNTRVTVASGYALSLATAVSQIVPGSSSLAIRDNANANNNLIITDAGLVSTRGGVPGAAAAAGSITLPIQTGTLRATNAAGTNSISLIGSTGGGFDRVLLSPDGKDVSYGVAPIALGGGAGATLGTIGATGPATATQNTWLRMLDNSSIPFWIPIWK